MCLLAPLPLPPSERGGWPFSFGAKASKIFLTPNLTPKVGPRTPSPPGGLGDPGLEKNTQSEPSLGHERVFPHGSFINVQS